MTWLGRFDDFNNTNIPLAKCATKQSARASSTDPPSKQNRFTADVSHYSSEYCQISEIMKDVQNVSVIGVIIAKDGPKSVISKKGSGSERHLIAFTIRDTPSAFINVTCWGGPEFINLLAVEFSIGDVVKIKGAQVQAKSSNPSDDRYKPWTPSLYQLNMSDNHGTILPYTGVDVSEYSKLLHVPTRTSNDYYTLEDIQANGMSLQGEHINILAVVKKVWPVRQIVTKFNKKTQKADVILCDEACPSFNLTLWDSFVHQAEKWIPMKTVIFVADVRISFNDFRSAMTASTDSKTVFTVEPDTPEACSLQQFCKTQGSLSLTGRGEDSFNSDFKDPDVDSINNVMTVREAKNLLNEVASEGGQPGFGVLFAFLSHFDIDNPEKSILKNVCSRCHRTVKESTGFACDNADCAGSELTFDGNMDLEYSFSVNFSDHTGTLDFCHVSPTAAEQMLGCKAQEFQNLTELRKTFIKWNFLLERVKAVIKIKQAPSWGKDSRCFVSLLALEKASPVQLVEQCFADI